MHPSHHSAPTNSVHSSSASTVTGLGVPAQHASCSPAPPLLVGSHQQRLCFFGSIKAHFTSSFAIHSFRCICGAQKNMSALACSLAPSLRACAPHIRQWHISAADRRAARGCPIHSQRASIVTASRAAAVAAAKQNAAQLRIPCQPFFLQRCRGRAGQVVVPQAARGAAAAAAAATAAAAAAQQSLVSQLFAVSTVYAFAIAALVSPICCARRACPMKVLYKMSHVTQRPCRQRTPLRLPLLFALLFNRLLPCPHYALRADGARAALVGNPGRCPFAAGAGPAVPGVWAAAGLVLATRHVQPRAAGQLGRGLQRWAAGAGRLSGRLPSHFPFLAFPVSQSSTSSGSNT